MSGIKYYQLTKGEELPDEFCAVRDIDGEPSEYTFYVPEAENDKLRELVRDMWHFGFSENSGANSAAEWNTEADTLFDRMHELRVEG